MRLNFLLAISFIFIASCATQDDKGLIAEKIKDCVDNGGSWNDEYRICKSQSEILSPKRSDPPPWVEGRKKQN